MLLHRLSIIIILSPMIKQKPHPFGNGKKLKYFHGRIPYFFSGRKKFKYFYTNVCIFSTTVISVFYVSEKLFQVCLKTRIRGVLCSFVNFNILGRKYSIHHTLCFEMAGYNPLLLDTAQYGFKKDVLGSNWFPGIAVITILMFSNLEPAPHTVVIMARNVFKFTTMLYDWRRMAKMPKNTIIFELPLFLRRKKTGWQWIYKSLL